jgi:hypothetical protein
MPAPAFIYFLLISFLISQSNSSFAQQRYDDIAPSENWVINFGGFQSNNYDTTIRIDSNQYGLGTVINLEDRLDIDKAVTVFKLAGFYRINARHRLDWDYFSSNREGKAVINKQDIKIGDNIYQIGSTIKSEIKSNILKIGWSYSFINTQKYEFYSGLGLNIRKTQLAFDGQFLINGSNQQSDEKLVLEEYIPLPTFNFGMRYNFTENLALMYRFETFAIAYSDFSGMLKNTYLNLEYDAFDHLGAGLGVISMMYDLEVEADNINGELEGNYLAGFAYLKVYF